VQLELGLVGLKKDLTTPEEQEKYTRENSLL
jgi:hypothetical protein